MKSSVLIIVATLALVMPTVAFAGLVTSVSTLTVPSVDDERDTLLYDELLQESLLETVIKFYGQGIQTDGRTALAGGKVDPSLAVIADREYGMAFEPTAFRTSVIGRLKRVYTRDELAKALDTFDDAVYGRVAAATFGENGMPSRAATYLATHPQSGERLSLLRRIAASSLEHGAGLDGDAQKQILAIVTSDCAMDQAAIEKRLRTKQAHVSDMAEESLSTTAYQYRDINDADLRAYADLIGRPEVQRLWKSFGDAVRERLGRAYYNMNVELHKQASGHHGEASRQSSAGACNGLAATAPIALASNGLTAESSKVTGRAAGRQGDDKRNCLNLHDDAKIAACSGR